MARDKAGLLPIKDVVPELPPKVPTPLPMGPEDGDTPPHLGESGIVTGIKTIDPRVVLIPSAAAWPGPVGEIEIDHNQTFTSPLGTILITDPTTPNVKLDTTTRYTSTDTGSLLIDETDPTEILFTATGGLTAGAIPSLFGAPKVLWFNCNAPEDGSGLRALTDGTAIRTGAAATYDPTSGDITIATTGFYMYSISGVIQKPPSPAGSDMIVLQFNEGTSILDSLPNAKKSIYLGGQSSVTGSNVEFAETIGVFAIANTTIKPKVYASWGTGSAWDINVTVAPIYGPGLGTASGGGGLTDPSMNLSYAVVPYAYGDNFDVDLPGPSPSSSAFFPSTRQYTSLNVPTPYNTSSGYVPSHYLTDSDYYGDASNPIWYPDGQFYFGFTIAPNLLALDVTDFTITVQSHDVGSPPTDLKVLPNYYTQYTGTYPDYIYTIKFPQAYSIYLPNTESYVGTSFRLKIEITSLPTQYLYFKCAAEGSHDGCANATISFSNGGSGYIPTFQWTRGGVITYSSNSNYSEIHGNESNNVFFARGVANSTEQTAQQIQFTLANALFWSDVETSVTFEWQPVGFLFYGYWFEGVTGLDPDISQLTDMATGTATYSHAYATPTITYVPPVSLATPNNAWSYSPVGHWIIKQVIGVDYWPYASHSSLGYVQVPSEWVLHINITSADPARSGTIATLNFETGYYETSGFYSTPWPYNP